MVVRVSLSTQRVDTIARVKTQDLTVQRSGGNVNMRQIPLSSADGWGVAPDGSVVIARSGDYHLEWHHLDGSVTSGPSVPYEPVRIRNAEKVAYLEAASGGGISVSIEAGGDGRRSMSLARGGGGGGDGPDVNEFEWPEVMPPMTNGRINVDPVGRAWVARNRAAGEAPRYDVFGTDGNRIATVELAEGRRILGFGEDAIYVAARMWDDSPSTVAEGLKTISAPLRPRTPIFAPGKNASQMFSKKYSDGSRVSSGALFQKRWRL